MDVLETPPAPRQSRLAAVVAVALVLLAGGQAAAVRSPAELADSAGLEVLESGYSFASDGTRATVGFRLLNSGGEPVEVRAAGNDAPGLLLVDVVASGAPVGFAAAGEGEALLPAFDLPPGDPVILQLVYEVQDCLLVPSTPLLVPVRVQVGRAGGVVEVALPRLTGEGPEDQLEWQEVLVREVCTGA